MVVCKIEKCLDFNGYELKAGDKKFRVVLDFFGVEQPKVGDVIALHKNLLDEKSAEFTGFYAFEVENTKHTEYSKTDQEIALYQTGDKKFVLKRVYG